MSLLQNTQYTAINEQSDSETDSQESVNNDINQNISVRTCCIPQRFYVAISVMIGIGIIYLLRINLSVAVEPMSCQFKWSPTQQGWVLSSFYIGYLPGNIPGSWLCQKYGGKNILLISVLSTTILTLLIPYTTSAKFTYNRHLTCKCDTSVTNNWCFYDGLYTNNSAKCDHVRVICDDTSYIYLLIILRILMGLVEGISFPALYKIIQTWSTRNERSTLIAIAMSGGVLGVLIGFPLSTIIVNNNNAYFGSWYSVFYLFSEIGLVWSILFYFTINENPIKDICLINEHKDEKIKINWYYFLVNKTAILLYIVAFCYNWNGNLLISQVPTYLNDELNYNLAASGIIAMLPYIASFSLTHLSGYLTDFLIYKSVFGENTHNFMRKIVQIFAIISGILLMSCGYITNTTIVVILLIISCGINAIATTGFYATYIDISPTLSNVLYGVSNTIANIPGILAPLSAGYIRDNINESTMAWRLIFFIAFIVGSIGSIIFLLMIDAKPIAQLNLSKPNNKS